MSAVDEWNHIVAHLGQERPCLRSGLCCKKAPCAFGTWDHDKHQCVHLEVAEVVDGVEIHACGIYDQIKDAPGAEWNPAFGAGCCMPMFNTNREAIARLKR